jgi:hypothetical protein
LDQLSPAHFPFKILDQIGFKIELKLKFPNNKIMNFPTMNKVENVFRKIKLRECILSFKIQSKSFPFFWAQVSVLQLEFLISGPRKVYIKK